MSLAVDFAMRRNLFERRMAMAALDGMRIAILEARMSGALASLIAKRGGDALCVPAVREADIDCAADVRHMIDRLEAGAIDVVVFQTGVGARALFREADKLGRLDALLACLRGITTVCRGPKPTAALKHAGVQISVSVAAPYTTDELVQALIGAPIAGKRVTALQYGERNAALIDALRQNGALVDDLCLYEWMLPDDTDGLKALVGELLSGGVDAIAFTSQVQIRHLYRVAADIGVPQQALSDALNGQTIVAVVGPTCAAALAAVGVTPNSEPAYPKMGHMVNALADYVGERRLAVGG